MSFLIQKRELSEMELEYAELKKRSVIENSVSKKQNGANERQTLNIGDEVTLSSVKPNTEASSGRKPSSVTPDEKHALRTPISLFA